MDVCPCEAITYGPALAAHCTALEGPGLRGFSPEDYSVREPEPAAVLTGGCQSNHSVVIIQPTKHSSEWMAKNSGTTPGS